VTLVRPVFDLAHYPLPILLKCVVTLNRRLQFEALGGVADFLVPKCIDPPFDVLVHDGWWDLLESHEVLLVE